MITITITVIGPENATNSRADSNAAERCAIQEYLFAWLVVPRCLSTEGRDNAVARQGDDVTETSVSTGDSCLVAIGIGVFRIEVPVGNHVFSSWPA